MSSARALEAIVPSTPPPYLPFHAEAQVHHNTELTDIRTDTPLPQDSAIRSKVSFRELRNLESVNLPGTSELAGAITTKRTRNPSYPRASFIYDEAYKALNV